jgi:hypothetical protein
VREVLVVPLVVAASAASALADETQPAAPPKTPDKPAPASDVKQPEPIQPAGSPDELNAEIGRMRPRHAGLLPNGPVSIFDDVLDDVNSRLERSIGLRFGMAYTYAYQRPSDSSLDDKDAMAGDADVFARCRFFGDEQAPNRGILGVYGEYRHAWGSAPTPKELAGGYGGLWGTTDGFNRQEWMLAQCWWEQHLLNDQLVVTVGKVDVGNFYNKNRYQDDATAFMSQAFSSNPARRHPDNGLGLNVLGRVIKDFYVTGGVHDANGDKDKSGFHTIDEGDFFGAAEGGWTPTFEGMGKGAYRLTVWTIEDADVAGIPDDRGISVSCEQEIGGGLVPFARAGWSDGDATGVSEFVAGGIGLEGVLRKNDLTGVGVGWGQPDDDDLRDQFTAEVFHRFQLAPDIQLTVGYQYIHDPSFAPSSNSDPVGVFEVRVRLEF